jgi:hypothetical protein
MVAAGLLGCNGEIPKEKVPVVLQYDAPTVTIAASRAELAKGPSAEAATKLASKAEGPVPVTLYYEAPTIMITGILGVKEKERLACGRLGIEAGKGSSKCPTAPEETPRSFW